MSFPTLHNYVFRMILTANADYFPKEHQQIGLYVGYGLCCVCGKLIK